jgi:hypothetical protein
MVWKWWALLLRQFRRSLAALLLSLPSHHLSKCLTFQPMKVSRPRLLWMYPGYQRCSGSSFGRVRCFRFQSYRRRHHKRQSTAGSDRVPHEERPAFRASTSSRSLF